MASPDRAGREPGRDENPDREPDPHDVARQIALRQLTMAPRSRAQLADKLAAKNVPAEVADSVLDRLTEVGLVDDVAFAQGFVATRRGQRGRRALTQELRRKGVDEELAAEVVGEVDDASQEEAARVLVRRKVATMRGLDDQVRVRRLAGMLARRGFPSDVVMRVVRQEVAADGAEFFAD
ncbi:regulatory protein RecX [Kineococcus gynurae]|uniref:Regulatory protein RecX n=1 Tax=Kineococcus gynurae TaxID=452979 RepID=A0ABV5LVB1_9ACTN